MEQTRKMILVCNQPSKQYRVLTVILGDRITTLTTELDNYQLLSLAEQVGFKILKIDEILRKVQ